jgi:hypothetical protein
MLVSQAPDGRLRTERFKSAAEYQRRLKGPAPTEVQGLHLLIELLDV